MEELEPQDITCAVAMKLDLGFLFNHQAETLDDKEQD
jgi:hypothetical protein